MADDINLPNLVSHLGVDLDGVSGAIADATRQGSAMGSALGAGINRQLDDLLRHLPQVTIDGDSDDLDRDLVRIHRELAELDAQRIGVDISVPDALRRLEDLETHLQRIGDEHPEVNVRAATAQAAAQLADLRAAAQQLDDDDVTVDAHVDVDEDRPARLLGILGRIPAVAGAAAGALSGVGTAAAGIGSAVPLIGSLVTTLANVAPAAGVAVTGMAALKLAQGTVKLAAVGMDDALSAALDPDKAEEFSEALEKLSPEAAKFATAVRDAAPALRDMQQAVQDEVFRGLADNLERTGKVVLPVLRENLLNSATALGDMAAGAMGAARDLGESGVLGKALGSASQGLRNLSGVPGIVVTALGQIAAAAGPSFERLTSAAAGAAAELGGKLNAAFEDGRMQAAIEQAIDLLGDMVEVGGNVLTIIGNIFGAAPAGGGLIGVLQEVTGALAEVTATAEVQDAFGALFETMGTLGRTVAPLLGQALRAIGPVITTLAPPVQRLIEALGVALSPVIKALGPVLESAAEAFGVLIDALSPILPILGQLVADLLPVLIPVFEALRDAIIAASPAIKIFAETLGKTLGPIFESLPELIQPLLDAFVQLAEQQGPLLADLLIRLQPSFIKLAEAFAELLVQIGPLLPQFVLLGAQLFEKIAPYLPDLIAAFAQLAAIFTNQLVWALEHLVIPALELLNAALTGDLSGAAAAAGKAMSGLRTLLAEIWSNIVDYTQRKIGEVVVWISGLPGRAQQALGGLASALGGQAARAGAELMSEIRDKLDSAVALVRGMPSRAGSALSALAGTLSSQASRAGSSLVTAVRGGIDQAVALIRGLPSRAAGALGGLGGILYSAGASLISGFIAGIRSMIPSVQGVLNSLTNSLPDWKGPPARDARILTPAGQALIKGFIKGIDGGVKELRANLARLTRALPRDFSSGLARSLRQATLQLNSLVNKYVAVAARLAAAQKDLKELRAERAEVAADFTAGVLEDANITTGHADVNSVSAITVGLQQAVKDTKEFDKNIEKLQKAGLRSDLLQQITDAGVSAGGATAAALAKATPEELKKINSLQSQLAKAATSTGNTVGDALYGAGIRAAEGLVAGLKSQEKAIEKAMRKIAENMLKTVAKAHDTHSPSRAFHRLGEMDMRGLAGGILANARRAVGAVRSVASDMLGATSGLDGALTAAVPTGSQLAATYAGGAGGGDQTNNIYLYGTEATPDGMLHALSWQGLVGRR